MDINLERFADFMARMIEKYADEMEKETEEAVKTIKNGSITEED